MPKQVSPLAPETFPNLADIAGVNLYTHDARLRYAQRPDLFLAVLPPETTTAAVFTKSKCPSAPVDWSRRQLERNAGNNIRAVICNAGNANAFTGEQGADTVTLQSSTTATELSAKLGYAIEANQVMVASTGVIGEPIDDEKMAAGLQVLCGQHPQKPATWNDAATAIGTTDTFAKGASAKSGDITVTAIAKGSGMIAPDMATMLAFIFTDAKISAPLLQEMLTAATQKSFNAITVDSDTSTSDSVFTFATAQAGTQINSPTDTGYTDLQTALDTVCLDLAHQIVRDGEGATKFIEVQVTGATSQHSAAVVARSIADSPLVKTAMAAEDANWGRIVMAVGKSGEPAERDRLAIWIGTEQVAENGQKLGTYSEDRANQSLKEQHIILRVDLGLGDGEAKIWTCDLTQRYIEINAGYRS